MHKKTHKAVHEAFYTRAKIVSLLGCAWDNNCHIWQKPAFNLPEGICFYVIIQH